MSGGLSRLMTDKTEYGGVVRNRILKEEVATGGGQGGRLPDTKPHPQMVFPKWAKSKISNHLDWTESAVPGENSSQNKAMHIECDDNCRGGAGCSNKRICLGLLPAIK